jgi:8-oxo-dGTP pyrophosphatase MutT (NUDIX family)
MQILTEIFRDADLDIRGRIDHRTAVRAVVIREMKFLMVYSPINGDYKFPGGGVKKNEKSEYALKREIQEECGMNLIDILQGIGCVIEYAIPMRKKFDVFKMTSSYYLCEIDTDTFDQRLDPYEAELGFRPVWVNVETAIQVNKNVIDSETKRPPQWMAREVFMLEYIRKNLL